MPTKTHSSNLAYSLTLSYCALLLLLSHLLDKPAHLWAGFCSILTSPAPLITDYVALAGPGPALLNSALVVLSSLLVLRLSNAPQDGSTLSTLGLMAGFSLFGKNLLNIWPILLGSLLSARLRRLPFSSCAKAGLMATSLAPLPSFLCFSLGLPLPALLLGLLIGLVIPPLSLRTLRLLRGMSLYNIGFACGLTAAVLIPLLRLLGLSFPSASLWAVEHTPLLGGLVAGLSLLCLAVGLLFSGASPRAVCRSLRSLLRETGQSPCDFLRAYGGGAVLVNMGLNGLLCLGYLLLIGGDVSGPTLGCILTVMGFSAAGKHPRNILPIMAGVALGSLLMPWDATNPSTQMAALFGATLAPISGRFGPLAGLLAGLLHGALVLRTGPLTGCVNLYNNGFSGGLIALLLTPLLTLLHPREP